MPVNRRALLGVGVLGASVAATLGALAIKGEPIAERSPRSRGKRLDGLVAGPVAALLDDDEVEDALRRHGLRLGDIDGMALGDPGDWGLDDADYLIPALGASVPASAQTRLPLFTSPLVLQARPAFASALADQGLLQRDGARTFVDAAGLLRSGAAFTVADPTQSDAAWLFAGLAATLLGGPAPAEAALRQRIRDDDKPAAFITADSVAAPARIGLESDLLAWIAAEPGDWAQLQSSRPDAVPVTLHLRPTVYATYTFIGVHPAAGTLATALLTPELQSFAALRHGLRGPQRQSAVGETFQSTARLPPAPTEVAQLPDASVVQALVERLAD